MKKIIGIVFIIILISLGSIFYTHLTSFVQKAATTSSYISIKERVGVDDVFIDDMHSGKTPYINQQISAGTHSIKIVRHTNQSLYTTFSKTLDFEQGTNNLIDLSLGPNNTYTYYAILLLKKIPSGSSLLVEEEGLNTNSSLMLDTTDIQNGIITSVAPGNHTLTDTAPGYLEDTTNITITKGYLLIDTIHLLRKPI